MSDLAEPGRPPRCRWFRTRALPLASFAAVFWIGGAAAQESPHDPAILVTDEVVRDLREVVADELVQLSVEAQNERYGDLSQQEIERLDQQWRDERDASDKPLIAMTLANPLSTYLTRVQAADLGLYAAIFVMDRNGLNVGQSAITSDYWQGDEAKFKKTFRVGPDAVFVDAPEFMDTFGIWMCQVNMTVVDRTTGQPIGSVSFDINLNELARRRQAGLS